MGKVVVQFNYNVEFLHLYEGNGKASLIDCLVASVSGSVI
jgi:hypothetical protein